MSPGGEAREGRPRRRPEPWGSAWHPRAPASLRPFAARGRSPPSPARPHFKPCPRRHLKCEAAARYLLASPLRRPHPAGRSRDSRSVPRSRCRLVAGPSLTEPALLPRSAPAPPVPLGRGSGRGGGAGGLALPRSRCVVGTSLSTEAMAAFDASDTALKRFALRLARYNKAVLRTDCSISRERR